MTLVFMHRLTFLPAVEERRGEGVPWKLLALMLNYLSDSVKDFDRIEGEAFPAELDKGDSCRPLPENYAMRGLLWTDDYFPSGMALTQTEGHTSIRRTVIEQAMAKRRCPIRCLLRWVG